MKKLFTLAMIALSVGAFAQQRQLVKQQDYRSETNTRYINNNNYKIAKYSFERLDLSYRQERQLVDLLKDKENEERTILRKYRNPDQKLRMLDREYDRKIQNLLSRSQYDKWTRIYAFHYETSNNKRWS